MPKGIALTDRNGKYWTTTNLEHLALDVNAHIVQAQELLSRLCSLMDHIDPESTVALRADRCDRSLEDAADSLSDCLDMIRGEFE